MVEGTSLYLLILLVELALGPLMSLVIYNTNKSKSELFRDYTIVGVIQLCALCFGLYSVGMSRPVYLVFVKDRVEVVSSVELAEKDLMEADETYQSLSWVGPRFICTESPTDPVERSNLLMSALAGKDIQLQPKYYRECKKNEVIDKAYTLQELGQLTQIDYGVLPYSLKESGFKWLPVVTRFGAWTLFFKGESFEDQVFLDLNPFEL